MHSALTSAIIIPIHCTGISEVYRLGKHDSWFLKSPDGTHVFLTFTRANIHYKVYCLAICCSSRCESLKQYKSQSFKTDSNDKSQQYATQHLSNKTGQSIKKIKSSMWYEAVIKLWGELIILLGDKASPVTQVGSLAPDWGDCWKDIPEGYSTLHTQFFPVCSPGQPLCPATTSWHLTDENFPGLNGFSRELMDHMNPKNLGMIFLWVAKGNVAAHFIFQWAPRAPELMYWWCCRNENHKSAAPFLPCREIMSSTHRGNLCPRTSKGKMFCWTPPNSIYILHIHIFVLHLIFLCVPFNNENYHYYKMHMYVFLSNEGNKILVTHRSQNFGMVQEWYKMSQQVHDKSDVKSHQSNS